MPVWEFDESELRKLRLNRDWTYPTHAELELRRLPQLPLNQHAIRRFKEGLKGTSPAQLGVLLALAIANKFTEQFRKVSWVAIAEVPPPNALTIPFPASTDGQPIRRRLEFIRELPGQIGKLRGFCGADRALAFQGYPAGQFSFSRHLLCTARYPAQPAHTAPLPPGRRTHYVR